MTDESREPTSRESERVRPETPPPSDRGISPIAGRFGGKRSKLITLAALAAGCGVLLFATWDRGESAERRAPDGDEPARQVVPFEPARRPTEPPLLTDPVDPLTPSLTQGDEQVPALEAGSSSGPTPAEERQALRDSARRAPVIAYSRPGAPAAPSAGSTPSPERALPGQTSTPLDGLRQTSPIGQATAGRIGDRNLLLTAGANLPCTLQTAMDSSTPGYVSCVLPRDVYSENGAVVLMERGTRVLGEYQGGLQQGRRRLFVLWTRAVTPRGITITLASPAADALGRAGFDGAIDTRFWDRFGGALLLSMVDDGLYAAVGEGDAVRNTARAPSDAAAVALGSSVDIPPTLRKAQGAEVSIFVARDLDFASVYRLRVR